MSVREDIVLYCARRGFSREYTTYWLSHPTCEGRTGDMSGPPHHIRTRGAGGTDNHKNLLALCPREHRLIHEIGPNEYMVSRPWLAAKIKAALAARR